MEEADEREEEEADLKRFDEACFQLTAYLSYEDVDYERCKILWGRDREIKFEAYKETQSE